MTGRSAAGVARWVIMKRSIDNHNPWLDIPAADYEGHMSHESVRQLQALNAVFKGVMDQFGPRRLAVLGCATGNGFEHIQRGVTETVVAIDINAEYLGILKDRYLESLPETTLICGDATDVRFEPRSFDHVHAGLFFEYVDPPRLLGRIASWLDSPGACSVVLQLPSDLSGPVTRTPFNSLEKLTPLMKLVDPDELVATARSVGLVESKSFDVELVHGKKFRVIYLEKSAANGR